MDTYNIVITVLDLVIYTGALLVDLKELQKNLEVHKTAIRCIYLYEKHKISRNINPYLTLPDRQKVHWSEYNVVTGKNSFEYKAQRLIDSNSCKGREHWK